MMFLYLRKVYLYNGMQKNIAIFLSIVLNCENVKHEDQKLGVLSQDVSIFTWKSERIIIWFTWHW